MRLNSHNRYYYRYYVAVVVAEGGEAALEAGRRFSATLKQSSRAFALQWV